VASSDEIKAEWLRVIEAYERAEIQAFCAPRIFDGIVLSGIGLRPITPMQTPSPDPGIALGGVSEGRDPARQAE